ncbi:MAG TPA: trypsin-like peptidase domain-containing protein, partial [Phenylobacterium sp.]|nr:trypsin-like peptidase domain-containing protein [Phenylobacterium sp.]
MNLGVAAGALGLAVAGGYVARAGVGPDGAVNARPVPSANLGAPVSFADVIQRVAPAVVSIEVEGRMGPQRVAQSGPGFQAPDGDEGGSDGPPLDLRRFFPQLPNGIPQQPNGPQSAPTHGAGSGFFISSDGYVVTNNHVVEAATKITVHTADDRILQARVIGHDEATDLAVL